MLPPIELLAGPWEVTGTGLYSVCSGRFKVAEGQTVRGGKLMIDLCQKLVCIEWAGEVALPLVSRNVGNGNIRVDDLQCDRIDSIRANYSAYAVTNEDLASCGVNGLRARSTEVADTFKRGRDDSTTQERACSLAQP